MTALGIFAALTVAAQSDPPKRVLVLMPFSTDRAGSVALLAGMGQGLKAKFPEGVDIVTENVAPVPPEPAGFSAKMDDWLAFKYGHQNFDAIVAVIAPAIPHAQALRDRLWPGAPILLVLQEEDRPEFPQLVRLSARVILALSNTETVRSALQMLPSTKHLALLGGASEADRRANAAILKKIRAAYPNLDTIEITGDSWEATKERVRSLPDQSIVLLGSFFFDRNGRQHTVPDQVEELSAIGRAPIFNDSDTAMGAGEVGGSILSVRTAGVAAGKQLAELLNGADPDRLPIKEVGNSFIVDWQQSERWHILERNLPKDATVLYRPPSIWNRYNRYIAATLAVFVLLVTLVVFLLIERHWRKREEEERKRVEEEARKTREQINRLSRVGLLGEMTASIAHELNQPLSGIVNNATAAQRFIDRGNVDVEQFREILVDITADGRRASDTIRHIRNSIKKGAAIRERIDLNKLVKQVGHMLQPDARLRSCRVTFALANTLPGAEGDPLEIQQVLINLVTNAFDAMNGTPVERREVKIATEQNGDDTVQVTVEDRGSGIRDEERNLLFEQFFTTKREGLGMGLAIVRSVVEAHGGKIAAENVDGGGARFYFTLPITTEN